jgi:hypothetical protein
MRRKQRLKRLMILAIGSLLCACTPQKPVYCHHWDEAEVKAVKAELAALPDGDPLHPVIRDYERVCGDLARS